MKLYPPIIEGIIPAFYGSKISIPFQMNKAVSKIEVKGFALKIKTVQNQDIIDTILINKDEIENFDWETINFSIDNSKLKIGQFYKVQLAYYDIYDEIPEIGYYSTVGIVKYTAVPNLMIEVSNESKYSQTYLGIYEHKEDITEKAYSYCFNLLDENNNIIETSGEKIHDSSKDTEVSMSTDLYIIKYDLIRNKEYSLEYTIKTINGLILKTLKTLTVGSKPNLALKANINCEVDQEEGYINVNLVINSNNPMGYYYLLRSSEEDNFKIWDRVLDFSLNGKEFGKINLWKDMTVKCGVGYKYAIQQYSKYNNIKSRKLESNIIYADFDHAFLYDGEKQLKIKYNPKISSFKNILMESKVDTIGNKFPFIFRNGKVGYKEFSISGLLSYLSDEQSLFLNNKEFYRDFYRKSTSSKEDNLTYASTNLTSLNYQKEKEFKLEVLEWLNNGKPKLFKSPAEGNYIVRLINVSLSPNDSLGRMLHNFQATTYEIAENSCENLEKFKILNITNEAENGLIKREKRDLTEYKMNKKNILEDYSNEKIVSINLTELMKNDLLELKTENGTELIVIDNTGSYNINNTKIYSLKFITPQPAKGGKLICFCEPSDFKTDFDYIEQVYTEPDIINLNGYYDIIEYINNPENKIDFVDSIKFNKIDRYNTIVINGNEIKVEDEYQIKDLTNINEIKTRKGIKTTINYQKIIVIYKEQ